jgi:hypothetical protein
VASEAQTEAMEVEEETVFLEAKLKQFELFRVETPYAYLKLERDDIFGTLLDRIHTHRHDLCASEFANAVWNEGSFIGIVMLYFEKL